MSKAMSKNRLSSVLFYQIHYLLFQAKCELSFFYHSFGDNVGKLKLQVMGTHFNKFADEVLDGHSDSDWIAGSIQIGQISTARIVFIGSIGSSYDGDIAIDDVAFHSCGRE